MCDFQTLCLIEVEPIDLEVVMLVCQVFLNNSGHGDAGEIEGARGLGRARAFIDPGPHSKANRE
eukprot:CAMPEP_0196584876 /NCGR_PEP_ID=MMETSP1081-20130531/48817_1 /TAXON_ID=36882 /ORGANISM="Pyramimonas amylifera, Strain CCMP720" /LENGTH=63 /DNA_ID=CAMNT_0041906241 /DNA_START=111 /DNA_END=302 /DNA_ORIENTATION=+